MRWAEFFFALSFGLGLPCLPAALGVRLPQAQVTALVILGVSLGTCIPAALDILTRLTREDELSLIRQREANTRATELANLEREARLALVETEQEQTNAGEDLRQAWQLALDRFFRAGDSAGGFSIRKLEGVVGSDTWGLLVHFYGGGAGGNVLRDGGGDTGYQWGHAWTLDRVSLALHAGTLPFPTGPVPVVQPFVGHASLRNTQQRSRQRKTPVVIDGKPEQA